MTSNVQAIGRWILSMVVLAFLLVAVAATRDFTPPVASLDATAVIADQDGVALRWLKITAVPLAVFLVGTCTWSCIKNSVERLWRTSSGRQGEPDPLVERPIGSEGDASDVEGGSLELSYPHTDDVASTSGAQALEVQRGPPFESLDHEEKSMAADVVPQL